MTRDEYLRDIRQFCIRGEEVPHAVLTDEAVQEIRSAKRQRDNLLAHIKANLSNEVLAKRYGIHRRTLEKVLSRETWSHL